MSQSKAIRFHQHGGPEVLKLETVDVPPPKEGEVTIKNRAVGAELHRHLLSYRPISWRTAERAWL